MEEGSFRCTTNISIRPAGKPDLFSQGRGQELNSFRAVFLSPRFRGEEATQRDGAGQAAGQETRGWVTKGITVSQRSKAYAHDYRYFPTGPAAVAASTEWVEQIRAPCRSCLKPA